MKVCAVSSGQQHGLWRCNSFLNDAICWSGVAVPRVIKGTAEKYGEKCYMDWDKQDLVIPAARDIPAHILDLSTE